jgi:hypothetical protein
VQAVAMNKSSIRDSSRLASGDRSVCAKRLLRKPDRPGCTTSRAIGTISQCRASPTFGDVSASLFFWGREPRNGPWSINAVVTAAGGR